ncbi:MAG: AMP-binding protein [Alphaproteobacteria bacterium]|jgi:acyl-CoA synthetase (AMP-forming)/AMP-acid ligase II|nr:AMP-binding protein [Alphaproteobacteria bacterium]
MEAARIEHPWTQAERTPDKPALIIADTGAVVTYGEMMSRANRLSALFDRLGLGEGDTVAFLLENQVRYPELCWAAKNAGLYYVCISRQSNAVDAAYIVENSQARVLITSAALAAIAGEALALLARPPVALMIDGATTPFQSYEEAIAAEADIRPAGRRRGSSMLYSSGTTGRPKGVRVALAEVPPTVPPARHAMLLAQYDLSDRTVHLNPGPFYHVAPLRFMMHTQRMGGTVVGFARFDAAAVLQAIGRYRATHGFFVPTMFIRMLNLPDAVRQAADLSSMACALHGAAPCPVSVKQAMIDWWGPVIYEMYGGTEGIGQTVITPQEWLDHKGSVGRPSSECEMHIIDDSGAECAPYQPGLIYLGNGRRFEYFNEPEKTAASRHPNGWATLGDIGYRDADGYLYLTDRQSNLIISGGVNIYPQEAENILVGHPAVADVAVIGVPHDEFGEEVKAVVQPRDPDSAGEALARALVAYCRDRLSPIKCPRSVDFVDHLPRSDAGKLLKRDLKRRYWPE